MNKTATIEPGQSLLDIAIQHSGSIEAALAIAAANDLSVTDSAAAGNMVTVDLVMNKSVVNQLAVLEIKPATGITAIETASTISDEGIEFWAIEIDFIVS